MHNSSRKRLIFCTYSSIYSSIVLKKLLADDGLEVVAIINSTRLISPKYGFFKGACKHIQLSGWRYATYLFMVTDLFSWLKSSKTVHAIAKKQAIPVLDTSDINSPEANHFILSKKPQLLLAAHFNQLVKEPLLDLPCINIHPSLLPAYKGVDPVFYAQLDRQKELGVSLHKMAEDFDTGEVILQKKIHSHPEDSLLSLNCSLFAAGAELVSCYFDPDKKIEQLDKTDVKNNHYDSWPNRSTIKKYRQQGYRLLRLKEYWQELCNV